MSNLKRRKRIRQRAASGSDTGQLMNLSLFIMLLAFFIVLNSLSSYEELKSEQARRSLELAFTKNVKDQEQKTSTREDPAQKLKQGHTFDRLDALFEAEIASFEATKNKLGGVMMVTVPLDKFDAAMMATGQKDLLNYPSRAAIRGNFFLPTLISLLRSNIDNAPTRMEIILHTRDNPARIQNQAPKALQSSIERVGVYSQRLENSGMPQKLINVGLAEGNPDEVDLVFKKYIPFSPAIEEGDDGR